ncbi:MAG: ATP-binding protein, partial [Chloroflexota bacterium]|nr:ATP-binding protein [Chloroflexota bacterium]
TTRRAGDKLYISFADTGCGIAPENLDKVFEPYFTTKPRGEGTGLGLYVCRNIVTKHGGTIEVESEVDVGTTFTIGLPLFEAA